MKEAISYITSGADELLQTMLSDKTSSEYIVERVCEIYE